LCITSFLWLQLCRHYSNATLRVTRTDIYWHTWFCCWNHQCSFLLLFRWEELVWPDTEAVLSVLLSFELVLLRIFSERCFFTLVFGLIFFKSLPDAEEDSLESLVLDLVLVVFSPLCCCLDSFSLVSRFFFFFLVELDLVSLVLLLEVLTDRSTLGDSPTIGL